MRQQNSILSPKSKESKKRLWSEIKSWIVILSTVFALYIINILQPGIDVENLLTKFSTMTFRKALPKYIFPLYPEVSTIGYLPEDMRLTALDVEEKQLQQGKPSMLDLKAASDEYHYKMLKKYEVVENSRSRRLKQIVDKMYFHLGDECQGVSFTTYLVKRRDGRKELNAYCTGTSIYFLEDLLIAADTNENLIAFVAAHELSHGIIWAHTSSSLKQYSPQPIVWLFFRAFRGRAESRVKEVQADLSALAIMSKAGFDPQGAIDFCDLLHRGKTSELTRPLSTHPSLGQRREYFIKYINHSKIKKDEK